MVRSVIEALNELLDVFGEPARDMKWNAAVVIQGLYHSDGKTSAAIRMAIEKNPHGTLCVLSTYLPEGTARETFLVSDFEKEQLTLGRLVVLFLKIPSREAFPDFYATNSLNQNMQRLSSYEGLRYAKSLGIEFSLKIRSDSFLGRDNVLDYLKSQIIDAGPLLRRSRPSWFDRFGINDTVHPERIQKARIAVSGDGTFNPSVDQPYPFHIRDFWYAGYTEDLLGFFDMSPLSGWRDGIGMPNFVAPESNLTLRWMMDQKIRAVDTMEVLARYFVVEDPVDVDLIVLRPGFSHDYLVTGVSQYSDDRTHHESRDRYILRTEWQEAKTALEN